MKEQKKVESPEPEAAEPDLDADIKSIEDSESK